MYHLAKMTHPGVEQVFVHESTCSGLDCKPRLLTPIAWHPQPVLITSLTFWLLLVYCLFLRPHYSSLQRRFCILHGDSTAPGSGCAYPWSVTLQLQKSHFLAGVKGLLFKVFHDLKKKAQILHAVTLRSCSYC